MREKHAIDAYLAAKLRAVREATKDGVSRYIVRNAKGKFRVVKKSAHALARAFGAEIYDEVEVPK